MELLNIAPAPILPTTMWLVFRVLNETNELTREELIDAACPPTMLEGTPGSGAHIKRAIDALKIFDMIEIGAGDVHRVRTALDLQAFTRTLRQRVLIPSNESEQRADDLLRALDWLVDQTPGVPYEFPTSGVFVNDTRWNSFNYWASFLGFARDWPLSESERSVDPSAAVFDAIFHSAGVAFREGTIEIALLLQHIESELPLLRSAEVDGVRTVLPSTAFALRSLVAQGRLRLERAADAKSVVRLPAGAGAKEENYISHATVLGATS
ncbi:hypothetical protein [Orlajensenia leifsoniae]|uniref:Uncharacterized protein n=1 Tax=Orlajensenia leifsoniae TaxID=2561933 RepID=A0A4Y9QTF0_9MICO|nr:hypothetical protein [Leifsonia flava]TFV95397.1 hypothetical protein E4M00_15235 [Leifsonia flava]